MKVKLHSLFSKRLFARTRSTSTEGRQDSGSAEGCGSGDALRIRPRKICMVAYSVYEADNRVRRYAETLARRGDSVDVISIGTPRLNNESLININGVTVHKVQYRRHNERSEWAYAWRTLRFLLVSSRYLGRLHKSKRFDVIHVHNMPDFLVFAAWYPKLRGARLILDIHDATPELFASKFRTAFKPAYVAVLKIVEKLSSRFADHVIVANHLWFNTITQRDVPPQRCSVILNNVDTDLFVQRPRTRIDEKCIIIFPGSLQWHQGVDIAIRAFALVKRKVPAAEFHIYSSGGSTERELRSLAHDLNVEDSVRFCDFVSLDNIGQVIANADLGVVPKRANAFGNEAYSTKIMEFMSQGVPVVASRTTIDTFYFEEGVVHFFESGNCCAMADAMMDVIANKVLRNSLISRGYDYVKQNGWHRKKHEYLKLVDALASGRENGWVNRAALSEQG